MNKTIRIGRDENNEWRIPDTYETVSNHHAHIEESTDGKLFFVDHSRNGSIINGKRIRNQSVSIEYGDTIRLANAITLSWNDIERFFPRRKQTVQVKEKSSHASRPTDLFNGINNSNEERRPKQQVINDDNSSEQLAISVAKTKWNWAAFLMQWIWGVGHDCWWPLFIQLGIGLICIISFAFAPIAPIMMIIMAIVSNLASLAISIYLGIYGNRIAWENGCFDNLQHFERKEKRWLYVSLALLCIYILSIILIISMGFFTFLATLTSFN